MNKLYDKVATSEKFTAEKAGIPVKDQSDNATFGLDWASRQQNRPQEAPAPQKMPPIIPVAN